jgi:hypothetical protein
MLLYRVLVGVVAGEGGVEGKDVVVVVAVAVVEQEGVERGLIRQAEVEEVMAAEGHRSCMRLRWRLGEWFPRCSSSQC